MSNVSSSSLVNYTDGETVTAAMLNQDNNVFKTAVNDNDSRIGVLENANIGQLSKIPSGTAWPNNPTEGFIFFRTDLGQMGVYHNSAWDTDPSLAYANAQTWVKGYGLGGTVNIISGGDANAVDVTGFYAMTGTTANSPFSTNTTVFYLLNVKYDGNNRKQTAYAYGSNLIYERYQSSTTWNAWAIVPVLDSTGTSQTLSVAVGVSSQSIPSASTDTQMTLQSQGNGYGGDGGWVTSNWTCPSAGVYEINTNIMVNAPASSITSTKLFVNGTLDQYLWSLANYSGASQMIGSGSTTIKKLAANDVLKFYVNCSVAGGNIAGNYSRINIKKIA